MFVSADVADGPTNRCMIFIVRLAYQSFVMHPLHFAIVLTAALASCAPIPSRDLLASRVSGILQDGAGHPVAGAKLSYVYRGHKMLGSTETDTSGRFVLGPFHQWFYLIYLGSPGVAPYPLKYSAPGVPDCIVAEYRGARSVTMRGEPMNSQAPESIRPSFIAPRGSRWFPTGASIIEIRSGDHVDGLPAAGHELQGITIGSMLGLSKPPRL